MSTPHNSAEKGEIASTVVMCGDPLRVKYIAENHLENAVMFSAVRGMYGYTGTYTGKRVSVMGHGMGMPSMGIYSHELYNFYGVKTIIRAGSAGGLCDDVHLRDIVIAQGTCTDSNFAWQYGITGQFAPIADFGLLRKSVETAEKMGLDVKVGNIYSTDVFYSPQSANDKMREMGVLAVEMEAAALYMIAAKAHAKALCVCTVSDHLYSEEKLTVEERRTGFDSMIRLCLAVAAESAEG